MKGLFWATFLVFVCISAGFVIACGDDDDDDEDDDDGGDDDDSGETFNDCEDTTTLLDDENQVSELVGISAADLLEASGGGFEITAQYNEDASILTQNPSGGETDLTITIAYDNGDIRQIESVPVDDGSGQEIAVECRHRLEVEVTITVSTADGAFKETLEGLLTQSLSFEDAGLADPSLAANFEPDSLTGSFEIVSIEGEPADSVTGSISSTVVDPYQGSIDILVEQSSGEGDDGTVSQSRHMALLWGATE